MANRPSFSIPFEKSEKMELNKVAGGNGGSAVAAVMVAKMVAAHYGSNDPSIGINTHFHLRVRRQWRLRHCGSGGNVGGDGCGSVDKRGDSGGRDGRAVALRPYKAEVMVAGGETDKRMKQGRTTRTATQTAD